MSLPVELVKGIVLIKMSHTGKSNFIARFVDASGKDGSSFANEIGPINAVTMEQVDVAGKHFVKVQADGAWTVSIDQPIIGTVGQDVPAVLNGTGSAVVGPIVYGGGVRITYEHRGRSNFIVTPFLNRGRDSSLVNEIGAIGGATTYRPGANYYLRVIADGPWSIGISPI